MEQNIIALVFVLVFVLVILVKGVVVVSQRSELVIERLGKYRMTLQTGFRILISFFDKFAYKRTLKEEPIDIATQPFITAGNVTLEVDEILHIQPVNSAMSACGIDDYRFAATQFAQTSLRSAIGKISLDMILL